MFRWLHFELDGRWEDTLKVWLPNGAVLAVANAASLKEWASLGLLILSIAYTVWRWRRDSYVVCESCRNGRIPAECPLPPRRRPFWCPKSL